MTKAAGFLGIMMILSGVAYAQNVDLRALAIVESSGNPGAIGDGGKAIGLYQAHLDCVKDVNRLLGTKYSHADMTDPLKAGVVAGAYVNRVIPSYLKHYKLKDSLENRLTAYNMGIGAVKKSVRAKMYIKRYREALYEDR